MQRMCSKLRALSLSPILRTCGALSSSPRLLHYSSSILQQPSSKWRFNPGPFLNHASFLSCYPSLPSPSLYSSQLSLSFVQVRYVSSRERKKRRKPMTPITSKVKKTKIKSYSSYKSRFRTLNDGKIRRWHEGKNHNAHSKSRKAKSRLRQPALVPAAYAKVMKKLNFCG